MFVKNVILINIYILLPCTAQAAYLTQYSTHTYKGLFSAATDCGYK